MKLITTTLAFALFAMPLAARAEDPHAMHDMPGMGAATSEAAKEFEAVNMKMHKDMTMAFTGNADVDFAQGMIPHHRGAIDMAKVVLKYGKDPEIKKLAEDIIKAQDTEIAFMKAWLAKQPQ
ncbi:MAG: DUF305 domain-containing protein [Hyphomicrobium sp.]|jgi:uncharacterized protein (DUF305 family)